MTRWPVISNPALVRWHSRTVPGDWIISRSAGTYRTAGGDAPGPGEELVTCRETDLWPDFDPDPPREGIPARVYPRPGR